MPNAKPSLFTRNDTFFGVCEALGEDFGFNPLYLRVALAVLLFFSPVAVVAGYAAAAVTVLLSRLIFPNPRAAAPLAAERAPAMAGAEQELLAA